MFQLEHSSDIRKQYLPAIELQSHRNHALADGWCVFYAPLEVANGLSRVVFHRLPQLRAGVRPLDKGSLGTPPPPPQSSARFSFARLGLAPVLLSDPGLAPLRLG